MACRSSGGRTTPALARSVGPRHRADGELISISRLEPAPPRGVGGIREITGPQEIRELAWQSFCTTPPRASLAARIRDPSPYRGRTHDERGGRRAEHCGEHGRVAHLEHPCGPWSRQPSASGRYRTT